MIFDLSEKLSGCLSDVGDVLIFRKSIFYNEIRIECFRAFAIVVKIVSYFTAGVCRFDFYFVPLINLFYMSLILDYLGKLSWNKNSFIFLIWLGSAFGYWILFKCNVVNVVIILMLFCTKALQVKLTFRILSQNYIWSGGDFYIFVRWVVSLQLYI